LEPNAADEILVAGNGTGNDAVLRKADDYLKIKAIGGNKWQTIEMSGEVAPLNTLQSVNQNGIRTHTASPSGVLTPRYYGELVLDTTTNNFYLSYALTNTSWRAI
jgi:hypothetical protein